MKAAIYARFSTELQREESIDDQYRACERLGQSLGAQIVSHYCDRGISGGSTDRPGYQALLAAARAGEYDTILTEDLSRLWRSRSEFGSRSAELEDLNVHLVTCVGDDTRRDGYGLVLGIKSAIAEHQRREISYRTVRGMEGLARAGKSTGGRCFGYGSPAEADSVRRIFRDRLAGLELWQIRDRLHRDGVDAPRGPRWSTNAVKRILANPRYAGRAIWGATSRRTRASDGRPGRPVMRPGGPLVIRQIDAIVDSALWAACNPGAVVA